MTYQIPRPISLGKLLTTDWPEEIFIEGGLLSRGDALLIAAESKAGKSTLIGGLIRQMIIGGNFLGFKVVKPLRVLYMQAELRESRLKERLIKTYSKLNNLAEHSYVWNTRGLVMIEENYDIVAESIQETKPDVVIIDPMVNFHNFDENSATQMTQFFRKLDRLQHDFNVALVMAQHFKKQQDGNPKNQTSLLEKMRGSSALRGWADTTIAVEGRTVSEYRRLEFDVRNSMGEIFYRMIKYNLNTREFDWHDPIANIKDKLVPHMRGGLRLTSEQFINLIIKECGPFVNHNRGRAFEFKRVLLERGFISELPEGKFNYVSMVEKAT